MPEAIKQVWVDWATLATHDFAAYTRVVAWLRRGSDSDEWQGAKWLQYSGFSDGKYLFHGHSLQSNDKEHYIIRMSGYRSDKLMRTFVLKDDFQPLYATRLDVQRTRKPPEWWKPRELRDWLLEQGITSSLVESDTGVTLYIGSRQSGRFVRIYEKQYETKYLRFEIELKSYHARNALERLRDGQSVDSVFNSHLNRLKLFPRMVQDYQAGSGETYDLKKLEHDTTVEKQLNWLKSLVRTFHTMANDHTIGEQTRGIFKSLSIED